jgi:hypothetical protein
MKARMFLLTYKLGYPPLELGISLMTKVKAIDLDTGQIVLETRTIPIPPNKILDGVKIVLGSSKGDSIGRSVYHSLEKKDPHFHNVFQSRILISRKFDSSWDFALDNTDPIPLQALIPLLDGLLSSLDGDLMIEPDEERPPPQST